MNGVRPYYVSEHRDQVYVGYTRVLRDSVQLLSSPSLNDDKSVGASCQYFNYLWELILHSFDLFLLSLLTLEMTALLPAPSPLLQNYPKSAHH